MPACKTLRIALYATTLTLLVACARHEPSAEAAADASVSLPQAQPGDDATAGAAAPAAAREGDGSASPAQEASITPGTPTQAQLASSAATYSDAQRRFIRTAQAQFRVKDVYESALAIEDAVAVQGGFVVRNQIGAEVGQVQRRPKGGGKLVELAEYTVRGHLSVRVPSDKAQAFLRSIVSQMEFLDQRNFEAADAQFTLLRQQLAYQRSQQVQQALGEAVQQGGKLGQKADVIVARGDALSARDEALVTQKEFEDRVAYATLDLSLYQAPRIRQSELTDVEAVFEQNSPGFFVRLGDSLRTGWYGVLEAFIRAVKLWPLWLLVGLAILAFRHLRKAKP